MASLDQITTNQSFLMPKHITKALPITVFKKRSLLIQKRMKTINLLMLFIRGRSHLNIEGRNKVVSL